MIIGGQNQNIVLTSSNVGYNGATFEFDATVKNLMPQPMGTTNGSTPSSSGVRVFLHAGPTVTNGSGVITVTGDGTGTFTGANQPYYEYSGAGLGGDGLLSTNETSLARRWQFQMPASVNNFQFTAFVSTDVPFPPALTQECQSPRAGMIWCDDFEQDRLASYFEVASRSGSFVRATSAGIGGSTGMRARFAAGQSDAGYLHLAFGKTPQAYFRAVDAGTANYREVYWRLYLMNQAGWTGGGGDKLSRATSFASSSSWAQSMVAHVWSGGPSTKDLLILAPASGTDPNGNLQTTTYNDFNNFRWLGDTRSAMAVFDAAHVGAWHCIEAHVKLNDAGQSNGVFELWIDGNLDAAKSALNWVGSFSQYGINAVLVENYWNAGSPVTQERYIDNFVVSTQRIGC